MMNQQQLGGGGIVEPIPITQEDREYLGVIRNRALRKWKILAVIASFLAVITIIIGVVQISVADIGGSFSFGAPIIVGVMNLLLVLISMCAVFEGRKYPRGDQTGTCFKCSILSYTVWALICFMAGGIMLLFCFIGLLQCFDFGNNEYMTNPCTGNDETKRKAVAIVAFIATAVLTFLSFIGLSVSCCKNRAFGFKSRNEILLEYQTQMLTEAQRRQGHVIQPATGYRSYQPGSNV